MTKLALVDDEIVRVCRDKYYYRLQVWRGRDVRPVVLMIGDGKCAPVTWFTTKLAQVALGQFLLYTIPIPIFFQYDIVPRDGKSQAFRVEFQISGHPLRPWLSDPTYGKVDPATIERVFGLTRSATCG